ncbi:MAG: tetratricopeptide repeat protein [Candidatus Glassbacteria bacterium]
MKFRSAVLTGANLCLFLLFFAGSWTDVFRSLPEKAEREYQAKNYDKALGLYQEAQTRNPDSDTLAYNLGNTLYQLGRFDEAAGQFGRIVEKKNPALEPRAIYNMGNTLFQMGRQAQKNEYLQQALDSFKKSIMLDPQDEDAKYNYELTHKLIRDQQQPPQQPPPQKDGKQDQKQNQEQQSKQGEQNKDQKQKKVDQEQKQGQNQQQNQQQKQQQQPQPGEMTGEEADRILDALQLMEKQMQQEEKEKKTATGRAHGPDW